MDKEYGTARAFVAETAYRKYGETGDPGELALAAAAFEDVFADPGTGPAWADRHVMFGHVRCFQYDAAPSDRLLRHARHLLDEGLRGLAADPDGDGARDGTRTLAHVLSCNVAKFRFLASDGGSNGLRLPLLDEAVRRHTEAETWLTGWAGHPDADPGTLSELHEAQGYLYFQRSLLTGDTEAARAAATHYAAVLDAALPTSDLAFIQHSMGMALLVRARVTGDRALWEEAGEAFGGALARAGESGGGEQPWSRDAEVRLAYVHAVLWAAWKDPEHGEAAAREVGRLLAEPGAEERLDPVFLDAFARVVYEWAGRRSDGEGQDRALAMLRRALGLWQPERDGPVLATLLLTAGYQQMRYYADQDPQRIREVGRLAGRALAEEQQGPELTDAAVLMQGWARTVLEERGLLEPDDDRSIPPTDTGAVVRIWGTVVENAENGRCFPGQGGTDPHLPGTLSLSFERSRRDADFALMYAHWSRMEEGSRARAEYGAAVLTMSVLADLQAETGTGEQRDALLDAMLRTDQDDPAWQRRAHGMAGWVLLRYEARGKGPGMDRVMAHLGRAVAHDPGAHHDYGLDLMALVARMHRAQTEGGTDELDAMRTIFERLRDDSSVPAYMLLLTEAHQLFMEARAATLRRDLAVVDRCIHRVSAVHARLGTDDPSRVEVWTGLALTHLAREGLARRLGAPPLPRPLPGAPTAAQLRSSSLSFHRGRRAWVLGSNGAHGLVMAALDEDTDATAEAMELIGEAAALAEPGGEDHLRYTGMLAGGHWTLACALSAPRPRDEHLAQAITLLEQAVRTCGGPEHPLYASSALALARAVRERAARTRRNTTRDLRTSLRGGLDALRGYAWSALLQSGTEHAAQVAAQATEEALEVAAWALRDGDPVSAVEALEACRGLTLHAAVTSGTLPQRLARAGLGSLADEWRAALADPEPAGLFSGGGGEGGVPSALRRRVLTALRARAGTPQDHLLDPPDIPAVAGALRSLGRDALVYLVPESDEGGGAAVIVTATGEVHALPLPDLSEQAGPLRDYGPAPGAGRDLGPAPQSGAPAGRPGPRLALDRLCGWAWYAAMRPLLDVFAAPGRPHRVPRLVLVPMGRLGLVPWHAAYRADTRGRRYALQEADLSYTASARLLCEVAARPVAGAPAGALVVGDPTGDLRYAGEEADIVQRTYYPLGQFLGRRSGGAANGAGTPAEVLAWLRGDGSADGVLHLACHASVVESARHTAGLALHGGGLYAEELAEAVRGAEHAGPALVVLAACRSHVSGHGHNEAFTLATAFLVAGARSVLGSLWPVPDEATSLLMLLAHHYLRREGESSAGALRRAQLWMLGTERALPEGFPPGQAARAARVDPADLSAWAGFLHLGR
ncbi:CHAT domain-containing protein [Streptomyces sp. NPDC057287]|uniref:CHAT domain-containing protein n=1 Tax=Streptomyces sp. NPDC057287 TaxID=3346086 RepID=UPI00363CDA9E